MLYEWIVLAQEGSPETMMELIEKFQPLLRKYTYALRSCPDAYEELRCGLIELVKRNDWKRLDNQSDAVYVKYIEKSIYRLYISLSQRAAQNRCFTLIDNWQSETLLNQSALSVEDHYDAILYRDISSVLTPKELVIIKGIFWDEFSGAEIAEKLGTSRQNINRMKKRALAKLKAYFQPDNKNNPPLLSD